MTNTPRQRAIKKLQECQQNREWESAHEDADDVLCELLSDLGFEDIVAEWQKVGKWYA